MNIEEPTIHKGIPLFRLSFRPFFLGAMLYAIIAVVFWTAVYTFEIEISFMGLPPAIWHAHEMIFGYTIAVIAGFLLTAIKNWTGSDTVRGPALAFIFSTWLLARLLFLMGGASLIPFLAVLDILFMFMLTIAASLPVFRAKQYRQLGIIAVLLLLALCNVLFYLGVLGLVPNGVHWGLYSAIYLIIILLLIMARRVIPFFIEMGAGEKVEIKNRPWLDIASLVLLVLLWLGDVFTEANALVSLIAALLCVLHVIRLNGWYVATIWCKPLLWVLYVAYIFIVAAFAMKAAAYWFNVPTVLYLHMLTYGGIGIMTMGMMARVILGHTGRSVQQPPVIVFWCFVLLVAGVLSRVVLPMFSMDYYGNWIALSQLFWLLAFSLFTVVYAPMLWTTRVDGKDG